MQDLISIVSQSSGLGRAGKCQISEPLQEVFVGKISFFDSADEDIKKRRHLSAAVKTMKSQICALSMI